jgi:hypothetical protein
MARSWEYSPLRRVAMQLAMWTILALTLGLASIISRQKQEAFSVVLSKPTPFGDLMVRLPVGWHFVESRSEDGLVLRGREPVNGNQRPVRAIGITQEQQNNPSLDAEGYLSNNVLDATARTQPIKFVGLKCDGVIADIERQDEGNAPQEAIAPGLYACAVLPLTGNASLAVVVSLQDIPPLTPGDRNALRQIVEAITLVPQPMP